jgi:hypothetical protein
MNVTKAMAYKAAQAGALKSGCATVIWFDNRRDGWKWDYTWEINWANPDWFKRRVIDVKVGA